MPYRKIKKMKGKSLTEKTKIIVKTSSKYRQNVTVCIKIRSGKSKFKSKDGRIYSKKPPWRPQPLVPQGRPGPPCPHGQTGTMTGVTIIPSSQRYFYFATSDIMSPIIIQANQFIDDEGDSIQRFKGIGVNSYSNVYINGMLQESSIYILTDNTLTLHVDGDVIYRGSPIILEIVQFVAKVVL